MKKNGLKILKVFGITAIFLYTIACALFYTNQERLLFFPTKVAAQHQFDFEEPFQEIDITASDDVVLNNILFKSDSSKGVILYLHGSGGSLKEWGNAASVYTNLSYDVFMTDYRGYGKSEGSISNEDQIHEDIQVVYNEVKKRYSEDKIIVLGYSLGSTLAAKVASRNNPGKLILQAPFYNCPYSLNHYIKSGKSPALSLLRIFPISPLLKYKFRTDEFIQDCKMPIVIFHGANDNIIHYGSSLKLQEHFKPNDRLIKLMGQGHTGITKNQDYLIELKEVLKR